MPSTKHDGLPIKREGDKLMTAEAVSKPLRKVSDAS